jgi:hypothetical protein
MLGYHLTIAMLSSCDVHALGAWGGNSNSISVRGASESSCALPSVMAAKSLMKVGWYYHRKRRLRSHRLLGNPQKTNADLHLRYSFHTTQFQCFQRCPKALPEVVDNVRNWGPFPNVGGTLCPHDLPACSLMFSTILKSTVNPTGMRAYFSLSCRFVRISGYSFSLAGP